MASSDSALLGAAGRFCSLTREIRAKRFSAENIFVAIPTVIVKYIQYQPVSKELFQASFSHSPHIHSKIIQNRNQKIWSNELALTKFLPSIIRLDDDMTVAIKNIQSSDYRKYGLAFTYRPSHAAGALLFLMQACIEHDPGNALILSLAHIHQEETSNAQPITHEQRVAMRNLILSTFSYIFEDNL